MISINAELNPPFEIFINYGIHLKIIEIINRYANAASKLDTKLL